MFIVNYYDEIYLEYKNNIKDINEYDLEFLQNKLKKNYEKKNKTCENIKNKININIIDELNIEYKNIKENNIYIIKKKFELFIILIKIKNFLNWNKINKEELLLKLIKKYILLIYEIDFIKKKLYNLVIFKKQNNMPVRKVSLWALYYIYIELSKKLKNKFKIYEINQKNIELFLDYNKTLYSIDKNNNIITYTIKNELLIKLNKIINIYNKINNILKNKIKNKETKLNYNLYINLNKFNKIIINLLEIINNNNLKKELLLIINKKPEILNKTLKEKYIIFMTDLKNIIEKIAPYILNIKTVKNKEDNIYYKYLINILLEENINFVKYI